MHASRGVLPRAAPFSAVRSIKGEGDRLSAAGSMTLDDAGPRFLVACKHSAGRRLDGTKTYELVMPPDLPAPIFWSVVLFDNETRCMIENAKGKTEIDSRQQLVQNKGGATGSVFAHAKPDGVPAANWLQTNPQTGFFACLRVHPPTEAFIDRFWKMNDLEEVT